MSQQARIEQVAALAAMVDHEQGCAECRKHVGATPAEIQRCAEQGGRHFQAGDGGDDFTLCLCEVGQGFFRDFVAAREGAKV